MNRTQFLKTSVYRGFTLIELLVVIAIIGLLSTIIAGPIQNARNKAKDSKKVADVKNIQNALTLYAEDVGSFPDTLGALYPNYLDSNLPNFATGYLPQVDKYMYVTYEDTGSANAVTTNLNYAYHLAVKLRVTGNLALDADTDCMGAGAAASNCAGTAPTGAANTVLTVTNWTSAADPAAPPAASDVAAPFNDFAAPVADNSTNGVPVACTTAVTSCVFDVIGQI